MCEAVLVTWTSVNNNVLDFEDLLEHILNGSFHMNLPTSFKKVGGSPKEIEVDDAKPAAITSADSNNNGGKSKKAKRERVRMAMITL